MSTGRDVPGREPGTVPQVSWGTGVAPRFGVPCLLNCTPPGNCPDVALLAGAPLPAVTLEYQHFAHPCVTQLLCSRVLVSHYCNRGFSLGGCR